MNQPSTNPQSHKSLLVIAGIAGVFLCAFMALAGFAIGRATATPPTITETLTETPEVAQEVAHGVAPEVAPEVTPEVVQEVTREVTAPAAAIEDGTTSADSVAGDTAANGEAAGLLTPPPTDRKSVV